MNIVCNIDNNYVKYCGVMMTSVLENNREEEITFYVIADKLSLEGAEVLRQIVESKYKQQIIFLNVGEGLIQNCPIEQGSHISVATYYRIFLTSILPQSLSKLIYLDCDLVVRASLRELWNIDLTDCAVGVVEDMWSGKPENYIRLHYDEQHTYFNAGVLLINLDYWRKHLVEQRCVDYIRNYPERLLFNDQDVLNAVLHDEKKLIPMRWNVQDGFFRTKVRIRRSSVESLNAELKHTVVIHFTGRKKPWHYKSLHPCTEEYFKYLDQTPWQGERPAIIYSFFLIKQLNRLLYLLRLLKPKYRAVPYE